MKKILIAGFIILFSSSSFAGQESSAREYAETVSGYVNKWIKTNHPDNPQLGTPEQYMKDGVMWYQGGVKMRQIDDKIKGISKSVKRRDTLSKTTESCTDSTIDNTAILGSIVATKAITKSCIKTVMDGYEAGE